jgi:SHAQKYF class myb-like DNA-binding protein
MSQNTQSFKDGNSSNQDKLDKIIIRNDDCNEIGKTRYLRNKKKRIYQEFETNQLKDSSKGYHTGRWTQEEHKKFIQGLFLYGNDWKQIQNLIETRSCPQARSHAQKFFVKLQRSNFLDLKIDEKLSSVKILLDYANTLKSKDKEKLVQKLYEIHLDDEEISIKFSPSKEENNDKKDGVKCNNYNNIHFSNNVNYVNTLNSQSNNHPAKNIKTSFDDYSENNSEKFSNFFSFNHFCQDNNKPVNKTKDLEYKGIFYFT